MAIKIDLAKKKITLSVGDLVAEPLVNVGRVGGLSFWTRMALGREAHQLHQRSQTWQHTGYAQEITVRHRLTVDDFQVTIQGRIDGVHPPQHGGPCVVEEIKSVVLAPLMFAALNANSHPHYLEQLRLYCFFVERAACSREPARGELASAPAASRLAATMPKSTGRVAGRLVYINVADQTRKEFDISGPFDDCEQMIAGRVRLLIDQARGEERRLAERKDRSVQLAFPHVQPRQHQDEMIAVVEKALAAGRHLMVSAPSGIGKTAGALFPVVKFALAKQMRVFFVTAKNTQQAIALETLRKLETPTAVAFRAREKMCINQVYACREEFCPHLQMFSAKLERTQILERLTAQRVITPEALIEAGRQASLCPFELALLEAERTDVIVCDYNYVFDPQVYFRRFFQDEDYADAILVIDEAHNLVQRAMAYYSPTLRRSQVRGLKNELGHLEPALARDLTKFLNRIEEFFRNATQPVGDEYSQLDDDEQRGGEKKFVIPSPKAFFDELKPAFTKLAARYVLDKITSGRAIPDDPVEQFFGDFGQFCAVLALAGEEFAYVFDTTAGQALEIVCLDPSRMLAERLKGFHSVVAMSATLEPMEFYRQMLGFEPERTDRVSLPSPFPLENRKILVVPKVSTTFRYRSGNYDKIATIIATTVSARRGNYMALFPSYDFMRAVVENLHAPGSEVLVQEPNMTEVQRQAVLDALKQNQPPKLVMAVQGGLFAEGVDYPGELLSGVIVVSPALPQVSFERELMRRFYDQHYGKGFEFAYLYPGMNRVIQSVGRLIRTETDCGVAVLVCQRFAQPQYSKLFPPDWDNGLGGLISKDLDGELREFWARVDGGRQSTLQRP